MTITGTHINYYFICHRKLWLFHNGFQQEHSSENVYEGKLIHETSYPQRPEKYSEIEIDGIKIDYYDPNNKIIHELKKSDKMEPAHEWQLKYYIFVLEKNGIDCVSGILEYPKLRKKTEIYLSNRDREKIKDLIITIDNIISEKSCPEMTKTKVCKKCSYHDFCFISEANMTES
jgi:CRISPR-associated exonuclease Cas4